MRVLLHTEFTALLARAGVSASPASRPARLTTGAAAGPPSRPGPPSSWRSTPLKPLPMLVADTTFVWHETLGVPSGADTDAIRLAMRRLALRYHPDQGGTEAQMTRINAAYAEARTAPANRRPRNRPPPPRP